MEGLNQAIPLITVVDSGNYIVAMPGVVKVIGVFAVQEKVLLHLALGAAQQLIENMIITLVRVETHDS
jgi:hypothetical protein